MRIQRLGPRDVLVLDRVRALFAEAFEDPETYVARAPSAVYSAELLSAPFFIALAAIRGADVVGGLIAYDLPKFEQERREFYLYDLAVAAPFRRQGIATRLIGALGALAQAQGVAGIFVQAPPEDAAAIALYAKFGVRHDVYHFDIDANQG